MGQAAGWPTKLQSYRTTNRGTVQSVILVTGASGNIGRHVVSQVLRTGAAICGLTRKPESVGLPDDVDMVHRNLSVPDMLDAYLDRIEAVFLVWLLFAAGATLAFLDTVTKHVCPLGYLLSEGVSDDLEQQTDMITVGIATELVA